MPASECNTTDLNDPECLSVFLHAVETHVRAVVVNAPRTANSVNSNTWTDGHDRPALLVVHTALSLS